MRRIIIFIFFLSSCLPKTDQSDSSRFQFERREQEMSPYFNKAYKIIETKCINCHTGTHNKFKNLKSSTDWIRSSLVLARNPDDSILITRLRNNGGDMPQGGGQLSKEEIQTLNDWINSL